jgi:PAS domain S-box-containing protein
MKGKHAEKNDDPLIQAADAVAGKPARKSVFWKNLASLLLPPLILLFFFVSSIFFIMAPLVRAKYLNQQRDQTRNLVMLAANIVDSQRKAELSGEKTPEAARKDALERIASLRFGEDRSGYFWVFDAAGILLIHPMVPSLVGKLPKDVDPEYRDVMEKTSLVALSVIASGKSAFVTYEWIRTPESNQKFTKTSYMWYYPQWNWVIGTGLDMQAFEKDINRFLFWIIVAGVCLGLASFGISFVSALRLTESKIAVQRAENRLSESESMSRMKEEQFETIFNTSLFGICIARINDNVIVRVNGAFEDMAGYPAEEILGRTAIELGIFTEEESVKLSRSVERDGLAGQGGKNVFLTLRSKSKEEKAVSLSVVSIPIGGVMHAVMILADITESKRLQERLAQSQKMDTIGQLAGGVAHDFNNMLTGILGSAEILSMRFDEPSEERMLIEIIMNAAQRAAELTSKLLAFSRRGKIVSTPIDVHESIKAAIALLERSIDKNIRIKTELDAEESIIVGDPALIQNAFMNLAINSRDAMPGGGAITFFTKNVELTEGSEGTAPRQLPKGRYIEISVSDTGSGIAKENLPRIFDPFFTTKPQGRGTGLGLAAVYGTIREHQGNVTVYSEVGVGTEFRILIPISDERAEINAWEESGPIRGTGRILVIDDESVIRNAIYGMLTALGYSAILAEDGEAGIRLYRQGREKIDLVILDMVMPGLSGKETFARLKEEFPDVKVIFSSGFNPNFVKGEAQKLGVLDFIQKPYRLNELSEIVARRIRGQG